MRAAIVALGCAAISIAGCRSSPEAPHGSPVLTDVMWVSPSARTRIWGRDADAGVSTRVPGNASEIDFVFDRRLDGTRIEDIVGNTTVPKPIPPIMVSWPGMSDPTAPVMSDPPFGHRVFYNSAALYGGESSYAFVRPTLPGFPSGTTVTFTLDRSAFTSAYGEVMDGPAEFTIEIEHMTVVPRGGNATDAVETFPPAFMFPVVFSTRPAAAAKLAPFVRARADGAEIGVALTADTVDKSIVFVSPVGCPGGWPMGALIEVSFAAGVPDAFGIPAPAALPAGGFRVTGTPSGDGGCL
jgi:hypothetical protein